MLHRIFGLYILAVSLHNIDQTAATGSVHLPKVSVKTLRSSQEELLISQGTILLALLTSLSQRDLMFSRIGTPRVLSIHRKDGSQDPSVALYVYFTLSYEYNRFLDLANTLVREVTDPQANIRFREITVSKSSNKLAVVQELKDLSLSVFRQLVDFSMVADNLPTDRLMRRLKSNKPRSPFFSSIIKNLELLESCKSRIREMIDSQDSFHSMVLEKERELVDARTTTTTTTTTTTIAPIYPRLAPWVKPGEALRQPSRWVWEDDSDTD